MDKLNLINTFVRVVDSGSFSSAAKSLGTTQPTISKQVAKLEGDLKVKLFERSTRQLFLTTEGKVFYDDVIDILSSLEAAEERLSTDKTQLKGHLRIACSIGFGRFVLVKLIAKFMTIHQELHVELIMDDRKVDLAENAIDCAIRVGNVLDVNVISQQIGTTRRFLVAGTSYLEAHGEPRTLAELEGHQCIYYTQLNYNKWALLDHNSPVFFPVSGRFSTDSAEGVIESVLNDIGVALSPS